MVASNAVREAKAMIRRGYAGIRLVLERFATARTRKSRQEAFLLFFRAAGHAGGESIARCRVRLAGGRVVVAPSPFVSFALRWPFPRHFPEREIFVSAGSLLRFQPGPYGNDGARRLRKDREPRLRLLGRHKFAVVLEDHRR
jgi:hypothetical protein